MTDSSGGAVSHNASLCFEEEHRERERVSVWQDLTEDLMIMPMYINILTLFSRALQTTVSGDTWLESQDKISIQLSHFPGRVLPKTGLSYKSRQVVHSTNREPYSFTVNVPVRMATISKDKK